MAEQDFIGLEGGSLNKRWKTATLVPRDHAAFREVDAALHRIAEVAASTGNDDESDWAPVYAAMLDAHRVIDEMC